MFKFLVFGASIFMFCANLWAVFLDGTSKPYKTWAEGKTQNYSYKINHAGELKVKLKERTFSIMPIGLYPPNGKHLYNALESIKGQKLDKINKYIFKGEFSGVFFVYSYSFLPGEVIFECFSEAVMPPKGTRMIRAGASFYGRKVAKQLRFDFELEGKTMSRLLDIKNKYFKNISSGVLRHFDGFDIKIDQSQSENWKKSSWELGVVKGKPQYKNVVGVVLAGTPSKITDAGDLAHIKLIISLKPTVGDQIRRAKVQ